MLDALLGRESLREEIAALEEELETVRAKLSAEEERRQAAVRDRQEADERVNRLEDRVADLEGQLERASRGEWEPRFRGTASVSWQRMKAVLDRVGSYAVEGDGALTAAVTESVPSGVREAFGEHAALVQRAKPCIAVTDDLGIVSGAFSAPMQPESFSVWDGSFQLEEEWFVPTGSFGFALVRSDVFAYAEYTGHEQEFETTFTSDVHGQHSKGGFSQARFERRRDEQIDRHLDKCRDALRDRDPDRLIVVGERTVIDEFADEAVQVTPVDATGKPSEALEAAFASFWTTTLYQL